MNIKKLPKRFSCVILSLAMFSLVACGNKNMSEESKVDDIESTQVVEESKTSEVSDEQSNEDQSEASQASPKTPESPNTTKGMAGTLNEADDGVWNLVLANPTHALQPDFEPPLATVTGNLKFDSRAIDYLNQMVKDCNNTGAKLWVQSAFRNITTQTRLYNNQVQKHLNEGLSEDDAKAAAATVVAYPGTSEHNTGLAVDFNNIEESFENTKAFAWLSENAYKYGFILRFPKDKQDITKIIYEPWHYRYVGLKAATEIHEQKICFEEYLGQCD